MGAGLFGMRFSREMGLRSGCDATPQLLRTPCASCVTQPPADGRCLPAAGCFPPFCFFPLVYAAGTGCRPCAHAAGPSGGAPVPSRVARPSAPPLTSLPHARHLLGRRLRGRASHRLPVHLGSGELLQAAAGPGLLVLCAHAAGPPVAAGPGVEAGAGRGPPRCSAHVVRIACAAAALLAQP